MSNDVEKKRDEVLKKMMEQKPESNKDFVKRKKVGLDNKNNKAK